MSNSFVLAEERRRDRPSGVPATSDDNDDVQHPPATQLNVIDGGGGGAEAQREHQREQRRLLHAAGRSALKTENCGEICLLCQCKSEFERAAMISLFGGL